MACNTGTYVNEQVSQDGINGQVEINLACSYGVLNKITEFGQMSVNDRLRCQDVIESIESSDENPALYYPSKCEWNHWFESEKYFIEKLFEEQCFSKEACTFRFE